MTKADRDSDCRRKRKAEKQAEKKRKEEPGARAPVYVDTFENPPAPITGDLALIIVNTDLDEASFADLLLVDQKQLKKLIKGKKGKSALRALRQKSEEYLIGFLGLSERLDCDGHWEVNASVAKPGYGPMLYDMGLSFAHDVDSGDGIVPNRKQISVLAERLWQAYEERRQDVEKKMIEDDSCPIFGNDDVLNRAYVIDRPLPQFGRMATRGEKLITQMAAQLNMSPTQVGLEMVRIGEAYFRDKYFKLPPEIRRA